jgi:hypothetical protein
MGCGCKNNANANQTPQTQQAAQQIQQAQQAQQVQQQSVQETIKKTIEKYYTVKKGA